MWSYIISVTSRSPMALLAFGGVTLAGQEQGFCYEGSQDGA
jgi:hypothetical protein